MRAFSSPQAGRRLASTRGCVLSAQSPAQQRVLAGVASGAVALMLQAIPADAAFRLPPIDKDPNRCDRGYVGNTIGQANAVSDKVLDLRQCQYVGADLRAKVLSGALMANADFSGANMQEAVMTKAYAVDADFTGADMTNAVIDRVDFSNTKLRNVKFINAVITGSEFTGADLSGADFEDALIGNEDAKRLCANPTVKGETRAGVGCRASK
eukprot:jgi/Ulvmu1/11001/UM007_0181.1